MRKITSLLGLALFLICGSAAFGQSNVPGFRGMNTRKKEITPAPPPAQVVAVPNTNCSLLLPDKPLSAEGLATPFQLFATDAADGACDETNTAQSAFVQAAIIDPATGQISVYNPLIITQGTVAAAMPAVPTLPANAIVALWFGFNGDNLTLTGDTSDGNCVNGLGDSEFTQFSYCNAPAFFKVANAAIASGQLKVPALGRASDGMTCPTVRDFFIVDQDQSDNLPTYYLITPSGALAQNTQDNNAAFPTATELGNPSDNHLLNAFVDVALKCQPWRVTDLTDTSTKHAQQLVPALALNELQARMYQQTPVALMPGNDPMTEVGVDENLAKTNLYRAGVDQPIADSVFDIDPSRYCRQILRINPGRMFLDERSLANVISPAPTAGTNLFTFLAERFVASYELLNCESLIQMPDPVTVTTDVNGIATAASLNIFKYLEEVLDLAREVVADNAADKASFSLQPTE